MKVNYVKTIGFRKFEKEFETELYNVTNITGMNTAGKSNILYSIINIMLGTNLSGDEKTCLINKKCDYSYGELHFTDNNGVKHILIRGKHRVNTKKNILTLDGKVISQNELVSFYKDKKLFLSVVNPLYFLSKRPSEQKEMVDKYLSDIKPKEIFDTLSEEEKNILLDRHFRVALKDIYDRLKKEDLEEIYNKYKLEEKYQRPFGKLSDNELRDICMEAKIKLKDKKYFEIFTEKEKTAFINFEMLNICIDIAYDRLDKNEQDLLEGIPSNIPLYITELNDNAKDCENKISCINGKIEYAEKVIEQKIPEPKKFDKDVELSLAKQELAFLNSNQDIIDKEKQKKCVEKLEQEILDKETEIAELTKKMTEGKKKYLDIKNGQVDCCPTCNQHIESESKKITIANMKKELTEAFDRKNLLESQKKDLKCNYNVEKCKYHVFDGETIIEKSKRISVVEETIKQLETEQAEIQQFNQKIEIQKNIENNARIDISNFTVDKSLYQEQIDKILKAKKVAQKLYILYIEEKMKLAKRYLKDVDIRFFSVLKTTGELKDDFKITYRNHELCDLSRSETIATALEFANMFNKIAKTNFPIFIDDYESCADYNFIEQYGNDTQLLISKVEKGKLLSITDYYNNAVNIPKAA